MMNFEVHFNEIERLSKETTLMDAVLEYAKRNGIDEESIGSVISQNPNLVDRLRIEAEALRLLPKIDRLPIE